MADKKYAGALDQGTTSTRFILFSRKGEIVCSHQLEHRQIYPEPGWVEHDGLEIWKRAQEVITGAMQKINAKPEEIASIGITNQRETSILWNKNTGKPVCNAIVWQDTRTSGICDNLSADGGQNRFRDKTGLPLATYFSGPKIKWILDANPEIRKEAEKGNILFGNMDTWLIWNLTGMHITDPTNASRTMLFNLQTLNWDDELLKIFQIPRQILPQIRPSSDSNFYGFTKKTGPFGGEIPVCGDLGDQQAALFGQTCFIPGEAKNTYGTGCFLLMNTGNAPVQSRNGLLTTVGYQIGKEKAVYALEGSIAIAGALVQWVRDKLGLITTAPEIDKIAASVPDSGGVFIVPAFSGLFAPYWRSDARGIITGLTHFAGKGQLARAVLEATAYQTREIFEAMRKDSGITLQKLKVDGGMTVSEILMQFQADILGVPVIRPKVAETTALGAAYAAGLAAGFWNGIEDLKKNWSIAKEWKPEMPEEKREELFRKWLKAVEKTFE